MMAVALSNSEDPPLSACQVMIMEITRKTYQGGARPWREDFRLAALLGVAGAIAVAALFPYLLELMPQLRSKIHISLPMLILIQSLQAAIVFTLLALIGLRLGQHGALDAPWLRAWLSGDTVPDFPFRLAISAGISTGAVVIVLSLLLDPLLPATLGTTGIPTGSALNGLLASFYGAIGEELQLRLFLMSLLVWLSLVVFKQAPRNRVYWFAIVIAALLFGAGHLPAAAEIWPLTGLVVFRTVILNAVAGVVFGWLFWRRGLEVAMLAHFCADLVLHVISPLLAGIAA